MKLAARLGGVMSRVPALLRPSTLRLCALATLVPTIAFAQGLIEPPTAPPPRAGAAPSAHRPVGTTSKERLRSYVTAQLKAVGAEAVAEHDSVPEAERWRVLKTSELREGEAGSPQHFVAVDPPEEVLRFGETTWSYRGDDWKLLLFTEAKAPGERVLFYLAETHIDGKRRLGTFLLRLDAEGRGDFTFNLQGKERKRDAFGAVVRGSEK